MTRLYNQLFQQIFSNWFETSYSYYRRIEDRCAVAILKKNGGGIGEEGNRGTSPARGHHQPEDSYSSMNPAHLEKKSRNKKVYFASA